MIYTYAPFGYEGSLVTVESDIRKGIPSIDIVGLSDGVVKESQERLKAAVTSQGFGFPAGRVLVSLSPCDVKKDSAGFDLPMALSVLAEKDGCPRSQDAAVLVIGELDVSGNVRNVRGVYAALQTAANHGIKYAVVPHSESLEAPEGISVHAVGSLREAYDVLVGIDGHDVYGDEEEKEAKAANQKMNIKFNEIDKKSNLDQTVGMDGLKYAMAVAVAGGHNLLAIGAPGCGKFGILSRMPELMPELLDSELGTNRRIYSITGLSVHGRGRPFRMPHQTASIEGMCGGGIRCMPGEITLAHGGVLFLDEAAEFRTAVLQMLRVPLESGTITLSRAGRSTTYPAKFQLIMATSPCPCGNYGNPGKVCLCSRKSLEQYWRKFSAPLLDRIAIRFDCGTENGVDLFAKLSLATMRTMIAAAWKVQHERQHKLNNYLSPEELLSVARLGVSEQKFIGAWAAENGASQRGVSNVIKLARTIADMHGKDDVTEQDLHEAVALFGKLPVDFGE